MLTLKHIYQLRTYYYMKKIGEGWQYGVYDLENGRVLKKFHSFIKSYWVILTTIFPFRDDPMVMIPDFSRSMKRKALVSFEILKRRQIPPAWIGNPKFLNELDFEQDKVRPLHDVFSTCDVDTAKRTIDKFVEFNKRLLEMGVIDKSFNITKNFGLDENNEIVLLDIGELFDDPTRIRKQLQDRAWAKKYVANCIGNEETRNYFVRQMDANFKNIFPIGKESS